jgi:dTDP-glucose pyrophosphorylase
MAGRNRRFTEAGYKTPKFLLQAHGKSCLEWSVDSLPLLKDDQLVFIGLREHEDGFQLETWLRGRYAEQRLAFAWLDSVTGGQSETVMKARHLIDAEDCMAIFNIDTAFTSRNLRSKMEEDWDGVLGSFHAIENRFSFAKIDGSGLVLEVKEKVAISNHALTGFYSFRKSKHFFEQADCAIKNNSREAGEFYVAPLYNKLIENGRRFTIDPVESCHILGTPEEYEAFRTRDFKKPSSSEIQVP